MNDLDLCLEVVSRSR